MNIKKKILDKFYPLSELLKSSNQSKLNNSNIRCPNPLHLDNRPSAKIYGNRIFCFTCSKFYYVSDIITFNNLDFNQIYNDFIKDYDVNELIKKCDDGEIHNQNNIHIKKNNNESFINLTRRFFKMEKKYE